MRARLAVALLGCAAVATGVAGMAGAHASGGAPGSALGSVDVTATAAGVRMPIYSNGGEDVENEMPWATASMSTGQTTHALTTVYWPGDTGGHGGDTLYLLGSPCIPPNPNGAIPLPLPCPTTVPQPPTQVYQALNDPYKAEAQSGSGSPTVNGGGNGVAMVATALPTTANASTTVDASKVPALGDSFGSTRTVTTVTATGPSTVTVDATSVMHDVKLAGGAISIASVTSVAHAVSDTVHAVGTAHTTVSGMTVGGVPVTVDDTGIHLASQGSSLGEADQLNALLAQTGFKIFVAKPTKTVKGAAITLDSGSLILVQGNPGYVNQANDTSKMLILGGAGIQASTGKGFSGLLGGVAPLPPPSGATGGAAAPPVGSSAASAPTGPAGAPPVVAGQPSLVSNSTSLPGGIGAGWVLLTIVGAGAIAGAMRRLPDNVLESTGPACALERGT